MLPRNMVDGAADVNQLTGPAFERRVPPLTEASSTTRAACGVRGIRPGSACPQAVEATLPPEKYSGSSSASHCCNHRAGSFEAGAGLECL